MTAMVRGFFCFRFLPSGSLVICRVLRRFFVLLLQKCCKFFESRKPLGRNGLRRLCQIIQIRALFVENCMASQKAAISGLQQICNISLHSTHSRVMPHVLFQPSCSSWSVGHSGYRPATSCPLCCVLPGTELL